MIGIYARQSVDKKDSISIESQIEQCKAYAEAEEFKIYSDKGYSGKDINRPQFEQLLTEIKKGIINKVIVYKLDRVSRSLLDFAGIMDLFKKHGVDFISTQEKFDTSSPMGNAMLSITMVFAQLERETIQGRIRDNYYARGKLGFFMGGATPYGYEKISTVVDGKKTSTLVEHLANADIVRSIFNQYAYEDMSLGMVSRYLNTNGIPAPQGGKWDSCKLSRIMRNPTYVISDPDIYSYYNSRGCIMSNDVTDYTSGNGCYLYGKREANERKYTDVSNHTVSLALHSGLIDSRTFLKCQYKLDNNKQIKNSGKGKHSWLSGLTKCGKCGYSMSVYTGYKDNKYLVCRGKNSHNACDGNSVTYKVDEIEQFVECELFKVVKANKELTHKAKTIDNRVLNDYKVKIAQIEQQIENLISQLADGDLVSMKYIKPKIEQLDEQKSTLIKEMQEQQIVSSTDDETKQLIDALDEWETLQIEGKKLLASKFIKTIKFNEENITIEWQRNISK